MKSKKIISLILAITMILSIFSISASAVSMSDGTYEVQIALWHSEDDKESMAADAIDSTATIVVENNKAVMHIKCTTMKMMGFTGYVKELNIEDGNGGYTPATVESKDSNGRPTGYYFDLPHTNEYISVTMNAGVSVMPMDVSARIKVDYSTLERVEEQQSVTETTTSPIVTTTAPETTTEKQIVQTTETTTESTTESTTLIVESTTEMTETTSHSDEIDTASGATPDDEEKPSKIIKIAVIAVIVIVILGVGIGVVIFIKKRNEEE